MIWLYMLHRRKDGLLAESLQIQYTFTQRCYVWQLLLIFSSFFIWMCLLSYMPVVCSQEFQLLLLESRNWELARTIVESFGGFWKPRRKMYRIMCFLVYILSSCVRSNKHRLTVSKYVITFLSKPYPPAYSSWPLCPQNKTKTKSTMRKRSSVP